MIVQDRFGEIIVGDNQIKDYVVINVMTVICDIDIYLYVKMLSAGDQAICSSASMQLYICFAQMLQQL